MITIDEARKMVEELIRKSGKQLTIVNISEVQDADNDYDSVYVYFLEDQENGKVYYPGELFPTIRKGDGKFVDFTIVPPGF